jgi:hypothetical protein
LKSAQIVAPHFSTPMRMTANFFFNRWKKTCRLSLGNKPDSHPGSFSFTYSVMKFCNREKMLYLYFMFEYSYPITKTSQLRLQTFFKLPHYTMAGFDLTTNT